MAAARYFFAPEYLEATEKLDGVNFFLPEERLRASLYQTLVLGCVITLLNLSIYGSVKRWQTQQRTAHKVANRSTKKSDDDNHAASSSSNSDASSDYDFDVGKTSYQLTNVVVNSFLGVYGMYYLWWVRPRQPPDDDVASFVLRKIAGHDELLLPANVQLAYQLWALAVDLVWLRLETTAMLCHHLSVVFVASSSAFVIHGCRYHTPFFYALVESSSVPLAVMNGFKQHHDRRWREDVFPGVYLASRLSFAFSFLLVRIVMWMPHMWDYQRGIWLMVFYYSSESRMALAAYYSAIALSALFLTSLQIVWASLIVKGLVGHFFKKKED